MQKNPFNFDIISFILLVSNAIPNRIINLIIYIFILQAYQIMLTIMADSP